MNAGLPRGRTAWPRGSRLRRSARRSSCRFALSLRLRLQAVGALMAVAGLLALAWYRHVALARFGGVTGDLAGWFLQWAELAMLAVLVAGGMLL